MEISVRSWCCLFILTVGGLLLRSQALAAFDRQRPSITQFPAFSEAEKSSFLAIAAEEEKQIARDRMMASNTLAMKD